MARRRWNAPKSLTPLRALKLLDEVIHSACSSDEWKIRQVREALVEHVKFGLERTRRRGKARKKAPVVRLATG